MLRTMIDKLLVSSSRQLMGWWVFVLVVMLSSCYNGKSEEHDALPEEIHEYTAYDERAEQRRQDSISFFTTHHYTNNYNFVVSKDSLVLYRQNPDELMNHFDTQRVAIYRGEDLVVAEILIVPTDTVDSVWVKLAHDQMTFGWTREGDLLKKVSPNDPISQFISTFSDVHLLLTLVFVVIIMVAYVFFIIFKRKARIVHLNDIQSLYPTALVLVVALAAVFYSSIQLFAPEMWKHFYYHPTLNPFAVPPILGAFMMIVWLLPIAAIAAFDDVIHHLPTGEAVLYLCGLVATCLTVYIIFSVSTLYYVGYPLLIAYIVFSIYSYYRNRRLAFYCGKCGKAILHKGRCPHCGTMNV